MDSPNAFVTAYIHRNIYQERGLLTAEGKTIRNKDEIFQLLKVLYLPKRVEIIHSPGHQKGIMAVTRGNNLAAKEVALGETTTSMLAATLSEQPNPNLSEYLVYME